MRILITGGSGFVGQALCQRLHEDGHRVLMTSRHPSRILSQLPSDVEVRRWASDFVDLPPEAIVNLAGAPIAASRWSEGRKQELLESRLEITRDIVALCEQLQVSQGRVPDVLVSASAMGYYGDQDERDVSEETPPHDEFSHQLCRDWEAAASKATQFGTRVAILRLGLVLEADGGMLAKVLPLFKLGLGGRIGNGRQYMPWVHRFDVVEMILTLIQRNDLQGPFNGSAPQPVTNAAFTRALAKQLGRPAWLPVPAIALKVGLGEMSTLLLGGAKMLPSRFQEAGFTFRFSTLGEALDDIL
ncbi:TIGR01777 family oxidoreductase [Halomonas halocynthiae]|uniref:TIGR01777 family oxidoreductase n=1 Tax=Halomonas halocynthiae TaxID=176290 RepID=UPI0003FBD6F0|nr:TIGR01777 family oxidoreductase [Halomonas halocynthiae]